MIFHSLRPAFLVTLVLSALAPQGARAQDAKVALFAKQLETAKDPRLRAQIVGYLGATGSPDAAAPLCKALKDSDALVRTAAARALGELKAPEAQPCLQGARADGDNNVKDAVAKALAAGVVKPGSLYVSLDPITDQVGGLPPATVALADKLVRDKLKGMGAGFSPQGEDKKVAGQLVKSRKLTGVLLKVKLLPNGPGLKIEMLVMTYPDQELKATYNVKASGASHEALLKAMVPRVVDDAARDQEWK